MIPSDHFVRFYNEVFKYIARKGKGAVLGYFNRVSENQECHCLDLFRGRGLIGMYEYWEHIRREENCDMMNHLDSDCYWFEFFSCPSLTKVFDNDAEPYAEYCNHCPGWILPIMTKAGFFAVYNLMSQRVPRCQMFVYEDREKALAKRDALAKAYGEDVVFSNF